MSAANTTRVTRIKDTVYNCYPLYQILNTNGWPSSYQQADSFKEIVTDIFKERSNSISVLELFAGQNEHQKAYKVRCPGYTGQWDTVDKYVDTPNKLGTHYKQCVSEFDRSKGYDLGAVLFNGIESTLNDGTGVMRFEHLVQILAAVSNCRYVVLEFSGLNWSAQQGCELMSGLTGQVRVPTQHPFRKVIGANDYEPLVVDYETHSEYDLRTGMTNLHYDRIEVIDSAGRITKRFKVPPLPIRYWEPVQILDAARVVGLELSRAYAFSAADNTLREVEGTWQSGDPFVTHMVLTKD